MRLALLLLPLVVLVAVGCAKPPPPVAPTRPPDVVIELPVQKMVTDYEDFTGRTRASQVIDVKARVTGHIQKVYFKDGDEVIAGQPLYDLDPAFYLADLERAQAVVKQMEATKNRVGLEYQLRKETREKSPGVLSEDEFLRIQGQLKEAEAAVVVAQKQEAQAQTFVNYTHIVAPVSGRIGRQVIDSFNLVKADDTLLSTIVVTNPMQVYFDVDDSTNLRLSRLIASGRISPTADGTTTVKIGLPDKEEWVLSAVVKFVDTQLNTGTGTVAYRADLENPSPLAVQAVAGGVTKVSTTAAILPGLFVRVRLPIGVPRPATLVPEEAIGTDQGLKFVYALNDQDEVLYKRVTLGQQDGRFRVIESGISPTDRIIVQGLQRVRPGVKVTAKKG